MMGVLIRCKKCGETEFFTIRKQVEVIIDETGIEDWENIINEDIESDIDNLMKYPTYLDLNCAICGSDDLEIDEGWYIAETSKATLEELFNRRRRYNEGSV